MTAANRDERIDSHQAEIETLLPRLVAHSPGDAVKILNDYPPEFAAEMLMLLNPSLAQNVLERLPSERRQKVIAAADEATRNQWVRNEDFEEGTIGQMMQPALAVFGPAWTVAQTTETLRQLVRQAFITYVFVVDERAPAWRRGDAGNVAGATIGSSRRNHGQEPFLPHAGNANRGCDAGDDAPALSGLSRVQERRDTNWRDSRADVVRSGNGGAELAGRQHGRRGKRGASRHTLVAQLALSPSVVTGKSSAGLRCGSGRRVFRRDDRSLCGAGRFPAGVDRAIG